ncbi:MAG: HD domain-containing phosphohydrolase [Myxococcota bacterium]
MSRVESEESSAAPAAPGVTAPRTREPVDRGAVVLVLEDEDAARSAMSRALERKGHRIVPCASGEEALEALEREQVDLALLDLVLPGMDGVEVCSRIRRKYDSLSLPVIFMTGYDNEDHRLRGLRAGADEFLAKPVAPVELLLRVRNLVRMKRYHHRVVEQKDGLEEAVRARTEHLRQALRRVEAAEQRVSLAHEETVRRLGAAAEFRDPETGEHLERMSRYSALLAREVGLPPERCEQIRRAAPMHDVGKIGIPDEILLKPGRLTAEEYEAMKQHTVLGHRILTGSDAPLLELGAVIALTHHERWDGGGYPHGLEGSEIPIEGRLTAIADVFDALTSRRVYKDAFSIEKSLGILREGRGEHFDPDLVDLFFGVIDEVQAIKKRWADDHDTR